MELRIEKWECKKERKRERESVCKKEREKVVV